MKKIFILTINGSVYVFNRDQLNDKTIQTIKNYTKEIDEKNLKFDTYDEACNFFVYDNLSNQVQHSHKYSLNNSCGVL